MEGACYDLDYARETVASVSSVSHFVQVSQLLNSAIRLKKDIDQKAVPLVDNTGDYSINSPSLSDNQHFATSSSRDTQSILITPKSFN